MAEPRALQVLVALHEAEGAVVPRGVLVDRCWGGRAIGEDAIQRGVAKARQLASLGGAPAFTIETIPRVGYRLVAHDVPEPPKALDEDRGDAADTPASAKDPRGRRAGGGRRRLAAAGGAMALGLAVAGALVLHGRAPPPPSTGVPPTHSPPQSPADPAAAALLVQARDDWAQRTSAGLSRSIAELERVTRMAPGFAPAFADLAHAYILAGEAGPLAEAVALDGAEHAAAHALALDPDLAGAHRAMGFILYWGRHDPQKAGEAFRRAIRLAPNEAQTRFWYANALADNGEDAAALREFDRARLIEPGSDQIGADYAWALWMMGRDAEAADRLAAIVARNPNIAEAQDCLSMVDLARGDYPGFLQARAAWSRLRGEPALAQGAAALQRAYAGGRGPALLAQALALELDAQKNAAYADHSDAAFYASLMGDRAALLAVLRSADAERETWGSAGYMRRIQARWANDAAVTAALARRARPNMEGASKA